MTSAGFRWTDVYTQCILQNVLASVRFEDVFDERDCYGLLEDNDDDDNDDLDNFETIPDYIDYDPDTTDIVPKKMFAVSVL